MLIFALLNPVLVGITRYSTVAMPNLCKNKNYCENQESKKAAACASYSADPEKKKAASRSSYYASPEKKRAAPHASCRADPEEKRAASRVASRTSFQPPRVPLFKAYL